MNVCISIGDLNYNEIFDLLIDNPFAEIRLDLVSLTNDEISQLFSLNYCLIATCREGKYSQEQRKERLKFAINAGASYVDIETEADMAYQQEMIAYAKKHNCEVIISYHNFECTPPVNDLLGLIDTCVDQGADVVKLITTAHTHIDCALILSLYTHPLSSKLVAFAMGKPGKITRLSCLYLGAPFTYAALSDTQLVAPGQMSASNMTKIIKLLK